MSKIILNTPDSPYMSTIDTGVMAVTITEDYIGTMFLSPDGECLHVVMRDGGFELAYGVASEATPVFAEAKRGKFKKEKR